MITRLRIFGHRLEAWNFVDGAVSSCHRNLVSRLECTFQPPEISSPKAETEPWSRAHAPGAVPTFMSRLHMKRSMHDNHCMLPSLCKDFLPQAPRACEVHVSQFCKRMQKLQNFVLKLKKTRMSGCLSFLYAFQVWA